ncbi:protein NRT1/ PTR FAMILY 4.5-like [Solanum dulcamara]|uniref:protein NRT1/ PTR FAMILY 4.5-like n=1 Tax=Solanum dulcamara TaxID=45834 RepID=UPI00248565B5|nr:protein NRT1/ PTR FAMILY 4.5-like [Solanum dulcamara]
MEEGTKLEYNSVMSCKIKGKGGFRASSFIYGFVGLDNIGFVANMVSMVLYLSLKMHFDLSGSANTVTNLLGSTYLLSIIGGFISDTYLNRFHTILIFGTAEILAWALMTTQARYTILQPKSNSLEGGIAVLFYVSVCLLALGTGGVRGALPALGADQFDENNSKGAVGKYFNWLLLSSVSGSAIGVTIIVWVSTNKGWWLGFLISFATTFIGFIIFVFGKPFYRLQLPAQTPPLTRILQVITVAIRNRKLPLPDNPQHLYEKNSDSTDPKIAHTNQFRCLDKAAVVPKSIELTEWRVCTVTKVEEVKIVTRMLPIIGSTIIMNTCLAQLQTFSVQQGYRMNRHFGSFEVPAPSVPVIPLLFMCILIPIYDLLFIPFARKITNHPSGITQLQRVGVGLVLSIISMVTAAVVEIKRKNQSLTNPLQPIHVFWLSFQYAIFGIADMFTLVGMLEFFYKEAPIGMRSLSTSFTWISLSFGYFLSSAFVDIINSVTKRVSSSKKGWLDGQDLDQNNLQLFYWVLAILSCLNFINYIYWATWYKYKADDQHNSGHDNEIVLPKSASVSRVPFLKANENDVTITQGGEN